MIAVSSIGVPYGMQSYVAVHVLTLVVVHLNYCSNFFPCVTINICFIFQINVEQAKLLRLLYVYLDDDATYSSIVAANGQHKTNKPIMN